MGWGNEIEKPSTFVQVLIGQFLVGTPDSMGESISDETSPCTSFVERSTSNGPILGNAPFHFLHRPKQGTGTLCKLSSIILKLWWV